MTGIEVLSDRMPENTVLEADFPCPEVGIFTMRQTVDLVDFGESLGLRPTPHNASGDVLWDVQAQTVAAEGVPRSHTADEFVWHTDASFENPPPRYFMLQVLHGDRYGGGHQHFMPLSSPLEALDEANRKVLAGTLYPWKVPLEFQKDREQVQLSVLFRDDAWNVCVRYRQECVRFDGLDASQKTALMELGRAIDRATPIEHTPQAGELVLVDNWRALHSRDSIRDPERHLQRVRFSLAE